MSHWNHRVVRRTYPDGTTVLGIHEAYCDAKGLVWTITKEPIRPIIVESDLENIETLKEYLGWMLKACDKPVLDLDKIPEAGANAPAWSNDPALNLDLDPNDTLFGDDSDSEQQSFSCPESC